MSRSDNSIAILQYQEVLLGKRAAKDFKIGKTESNDSVGPDLVRFMTEVILDWTPKQAAERMNAYIGKKLYLDGILSRDTFREDAKSGKIVRTQTNGRVSLERVNFKKLINICYPADESVRYSLLDEKLKEYQDVRERQNLNKNGAQMDGARLPAGFILRDDESVATALHLICKIDVIPRIRAEGPSEHGMVYDLYSFWANSTKITKLLDDLGLRDVLGKHMKGVGCYSFYELFCRHAKALGVHDPALVKAFAVKAMISISEPAKKGA